jgi:hypothetical protein
MAPKKNLFEEFLKLDGAINDDIDPFATVLRSRSPSMDFIFGKTHGLPRGYSMVLYGPPKAGKSLVVNQMIGQAHHDYENSFVVKFNTEHRERAQLPRSAYPKWGIDGKRYIPIETNSPSLFDTIETELPKMAEKGADIALVIIDSLNAIKGRRGMNTDTVMTQNIGDEALTIKVGLKRILETQRRLGFGLILTTHIAAELDMQEQMRGNKFKMSTGFGAQHHAEYFILVEPNKTAKGKTDLSGHTFENEGMKDMGDRAEKTGHKIRVVMKDSSFGPKGRVGEFTLDYNAGIINQHEEVYLLAKRRGVLERPNNTMYVWNGRQWRGEQAMLDAIKADVNLQNELLIELRRRDVEGILPERPVVIDDDEPSTLLSDLGGENEQGESIIEK